MPNFEIEKLKRLPLRPDEVWQGAMVQMPVPTDDGERPPYRAYVPFWLAVKSDRVAGGHPVEPERADHALMWRTLMELTASGELAGYRPGRIEVRDPDLAGFLKPKLAGTGIILACRDRLPELERAVDHMGEHIRGNPALKGWETGKGVTIERMNGFAEASEAFFRAAPWRHLGDADLVCVEAPSPPEAMRYFTVMGAAGQEYGLGFFGSPEQWWAVYRDEDPFTVQGDEQAPLWSMMACTVQHLPLSDAELWQQQALPLLDRTRYPLLMGYAPGRSPVRADATRLAWVEAVLRAMARTQPAQIDGGRWSVDVQTVDGPVTVTLALPDLLEPPDRQQWLRRGFEPDRRAIDQMQMQMARLLEDRQVSDPEDINALVQSELVGKEIDRERFPPRNAHEKAQQLCFEAFDCFGRRRVQLAREALEIDPDCADAWVLLAENTGDADEQVRLFEKGVAAGERTLGPERLEQDAGHFWAMPGTRPYMRARFGLARCLAQRGCDEQAIDHYRAMLRLNPADNQGVREYLIPTLMKANRDREASQHLAETPDEGRPWCAYARALLGYRLYGKGPHARDRLNRALAVAPLTPLLLLSGILPDDFEQVASERELQDGWMIVSVLHELYARTPGALAWLEDEYRHWQRRYQDESPTHSTGPKQHRKRRKRKKSR